MISVSKIAVLDYDKCINCRICEKVCPVTAIEFSPERKIVVDDNQCRACGICALRCPKEAIQLELRDRPIDFPSEAEGQVSEELVNEVCLNAHMYPEQVVCFCFRTKAKDIAKAILLGADTPEKVAILTGARTGCGVLCITGVVRLLKAANVELKEAPGYQWYGKMATIWEVPQSVIDKYDKEYYITADQRIMNKIFPGGGKNE